MPKISCQGQILFFLKSHLKKDDFAKKKLEQKILIYYTNMAIFLEKIIKYFTSHLL